MDKNRRVKRTASIKKTKSPRERIVHRRLRADPKQEYIAYVPRVRASDMRVFVSVHGLARNSKEQAKIFLSFCERHGVAMIAPVFSAEHHADYQRLGRLGRGGARADLTLNACVDELGLLTGADTSKFSLFGYSGGAQFAHRYLMAHPHRVAGVVITAAGWYTFPDTQRAFPYGIRTTRKLPRVVFNPEEFLRVPITVLVGDRDVGLTAVRSSKRLNEQQGKNRLERARKWVATMRAAAEAYGLEPLVTYQEVPAMDHSFSRFCRRGALAERVFGALFGDIEMQPSGLSQRDPRYSEPHNSGAIKTSKRDFFLDSHEAINIEGH